METLVSILEATEKLNCSRPMVYKLIYEGSLESVLDEAENRKIKADSLNNYIDGMKRRGDKEIGKREQVVSDVFAELCRAEELHVDYPQDLFRGLAILTEEVGELAQAIIDDEYKEPCPDKIYEEGVQTAAMALRFLFNFKGGE
jgi:excisionase family DNA binding protein